MSGTLYKLQCFKGMFSGVNPTWWKRTSSRYHYLQTLYAGRVPHKLAAVQWRIRHGFYHDIYLAPFSFQCADRARRRETMTALRLVIWWQTAVRGVTRCWKSTYHKERVYAGMLLPTDHRAGCIKATEVTVLSK